MHSEIADKMTQKSAIAVNQDQVVRARHAAKAPVLVTQASYDIVIVGAGAAGMAVVASLLARDAGLDIAVIDAADVNTYQAGWTLVGAGVFEPRQTVRTIASLMPDKVHWIKEKVVAFEPEQNAVVLEACRVVKYRQLVVCPGLKLNWDGIEGLAETLGRNGVTSNYRYDLAPYTWELVQQLKGGTAFFTQPPAPIKCAGAPQKAMYLSADRWRRNGTLADIDVQFFSAGAVLFGVADYVPVLMGYIDRYDIGLNFGHTLSAVDGAAGRATFVTARPDGSQASTTLDFDMLHVVPPQSAPDCVRSSPLADAAGWVDVDKTSLRHTHFENIYGLGDASNSPNGKTAASVRKQAPVVAHNVLVGLRKLTGEACYDGYASCPVTVELGKVVLAEFTYGGKLAPSFPNWMLDGTQATRAAWMLKEHVLPLMYWQGMLKGREWMAQPVMDEAG